jgi:hypothetical protein
VSGFKAQEPVVPASEVKQLKAQIRELKRILGNSQTPLSARSAHAHAAPPKLREHHPTPHVHQPAPCRDRHLTRWLTGT